jgi:hypothetical protein
MNDRRPTLSTDRPHRERLEKKLLAAFDAQFVGPSLPRVRWRRHATAVVVLVALLAASQVPANYRLAVGKRISVEFSGKSPPKESAQALIQALGLRADDRRSLTLQLRARSGGSSILNADAWSDRLPPDEAIVARLQALPEFSDAKISVTELQGEIHGSLGGLVRHLLLNPAGTAEARERAREALIQELRELEGPDANVDVQLENEDGRHYIRVRVELQTRTPSSSK